ncbi:carbohydrate porin [Novosphingobium pokkalii]|uniref:Carbohydrate porin n=1 Tax=Novosphingobium pokkalii TaxID=1770194 RepID=A0ABV7V3D9_9SPHN|nr:carbohydrate porin [Novosphingobium pokkalii]GHC90932.1 porin [Novosphingobium pokkalii]
MRRWSCQAAASLALAAPLAVQAQEAPPPPRLLGLGASYVADALHVADGGVARGGGLAARADAWVDLNGAALGVSRLTAHVDMIAVHGPVFSDSWAGDAQGISSIQAPSRHHLYEAWVRWQASDNAAPLAIATKIGLIDVNTEFDVQSVGALFVHASHGTGAELAQSGPNGPGIFPMAASGALVTASTAGKLTVRLGAFDAQAGSVNNDRLPAFRLPGTTGALLIGEVEVPLGQGELQLGVWRYTRAMPRVDDDTRNARSHGAYALLEGPLAPHWHGWVRLGLADARSNPISCYLGTGLVREAGAWQLGVAMAHARLGGRARATLRADGLASAHETAFELTAARPVTGWLTLQPELQYVIHPGWDPALRSALVWGMRFKLTWSR